MVRQVSQRPGIVTPEAVPLEFQAAGIGSRCIALLIDLGIQFTALMVVVIATGFAVEVGGGFGLPDWLGVTIVLLLVMAILFGYPTALETLWNGRTVGKTAMGLRVVTREGAPIRFRHAAIRAALGLVDFFATGGAAAVLSALLSRQHQRLGDLVAGTLVLRERTGLIAPSAVRFTVPPGGESYAAALDPAVLSPKEYASVRAFLLRAQQLDPQVRAGLSRTLAEPLAQRLGHRPPPNVTPELFLVCLAARYQQRTPAAATHSSVRPASGLPPPPF